MTRTSNAAIDRVTFATARGGDAARLRHAARAFAIAGAIATAAWLRAALTAAGVSDAFVLGGLFGVWLLATSYVARSRASPPSMRAIALGIVGGAVLVAISFVSRQLPGPPLLPAAPIAPWFTVTILVAVSEELALRGSLFDALDESAGTPVAVAVTSLLFALIHVPLYGWHVLALDVGVGLWLGGLRLASRSVTAPAVAHALADIASWWL